MAAEAFAAGDFAKVLEVIESSSEESEQRLAALACVRLGRLEEAIERLDKVLSMGQHADDAQLQAERKSCAGKLALMCADAANDLFMAGELDAALEAYNDVNLDDCSDVAKFAVLNNRGALHLQVWLGFVLGWVVLGPLSFFFSGQHNFTSHTRNNPHTPHLSHNCLFFFLFLSFAYVF
jgi:tetratricopeptide (TPR) repeat protein